ncbi:MAG: hypothetical protein IJI01_06395 [Butyrivibrio sp.]|uniref:hypothetical protein n=1 Tax=Butyrivibrio sp. TaxID=28121 RepID=UPI0025C4F96C|nr:hypothetical protein [Butyrivibrio sp.]MBQ6588290.1 hypothetical protein [Butyrivibrio sp.]
MISINSRSGIKYPDCKVNADGIPCTDSSCGRMIHIYPEKNLRAYPGVLRGTEEWDNTYKIHHHECIRSLKPLIA